MLSATYTVVDVKDLLGKPYGDYGFESDDAFTRMIRKMAVQAKLTYITPYIATTTYTVIAAKDREEVSAFEETEEYVYWAEVNFICSAFMGWKALQALQDIGGSSHSIATEGYSESTSGKDPGYNSASLDFYNQASAFMAQAGYPINRMQRGGRFFSEDIRRASEGFLE